MNKVLINANVIEDDERYNGLFTKKEKVEKQLEKDLRNTKNNVLDKISQFFLLVLVVIFSASIPGLLLSLILFNLTAIIVFSLCLVVSFLWFIFSSILNAKITAEFTDQRQLISDFKSQIKNASIDKTAEILKEQYGAVVVDRKFLFSGTGSSRIKFDDGRTGVLNKLNFNKEDGIEIFVTFPEPALPNAPKLNLSKQNDIKSFDVIDNLKNI